MPQATVGIIGAGFAGAATAYFLTRAGVCDVVVFEQEAQAGVHASGNNAAMARQFVLDPVIQAYAIRGTAFLYNPPAEVAEHPLIRPIGSLLLFDAAAEATMGCAAAEGHRRGLGSTIVRRAECEARVPVLRDTDFTSAVWTPTDGVVDTHAYLYGLLRAAQSHGARVVTQARVTAIRQTTGGCEVDANGTTWQCAIVVNAAGAWADGLAELAGVPPRGLSPLRRHLFLGITKESDSLGVTKVSDTFWGSYPQGDAAWPFVWDNTHDYYFRPESGGLLLCACDESPCTPGVPAVDPHAAEILAAKLVAHCPGLRGIRIAKSWAGLRTFAPDRRFVLGWDRQAPWFYWVAGLGGHGVTCAAAVGEHAAQQIAQALK